MAQVGEEIALRPARGNRCLVGSAQLLLGSLPLGNVAEDHDTAAQRSVFIAKRPAIYAEEKSFGTAGVADEGLDVGNFFAPHGPSQRQLLGRVGGYAIRKENAIVPRPIVDADILSADAEQPLRDRIEVNESTGRVGNHDAVGHILEN